jgi:two-component system, NarL family, response regulator LiaR
MNQEISILIVDDHAVVRQGLRAYLATQPFLTILGEASSGQEAIRMTGELVPDVVLMDLVMPGMGGIEATREIKRISPRTQVLVLTSYQDDEHIFPALRAGATSYLLKDVEMETLADAIRKAAHGEASLHPHVASRVIQEMHGARAEADHAFGDLTEREMEVLKLIANGLSNAQIAEQLVISEYTVKGHVSNILSKLHLADRTQAAVLAWQQGVVRRD